MAGLAPQIDEAIRWFRNIYLTGVPFLLRQNDTAFLSFVCVVCAIDALAGYRYDCPRVGDRFTRFISGYFPAPYTSHAPNLYLFRCRLLHNFSPAYFSLVHDRPKDHLTASSIGDTVLSDDVFFSDMRAAAERYFAEVHTSSEVQKLMLARLENVREGGAISVT